MLPSDFVLHFSYQQRQGRNQIEIPAVISIHPPFLSKISRKTITLVILSEGYLYFSHMGTIFMVFHGPETADFWCSGENTES